MEDATLMSRLQFAFTVGYHYLFPQLTMGLALLIVILKTLYLRRRDETFNDGVHFWSRIFAVTFVIGVVTGIPLEFQFGTNWALFSTSAGNIIAQTLAMEGAFAFFLESAFLGLLLFGEQRFGHKVHWFAAVMVWLGTWASGLFIIITNSWLQNPVGYKVVQGDLELSNYWAVLTNYWALPQYLHTMSGAVVTGSFTMAGLGAYYLLLGKHERYGRMFITTGVIMGLLASGFSLFPSGDMEGAQVARRQPVKLAAMEGLFKTEEGAGIVLIGQPDVERQRLDNPLVVPRALSFLTHKRWGAEVKGLDAFPRERWPDNIPLLYYSYHIMVGLGTFFVGIMGLAALLLWRRRLFRTKWMLWVLMLSVPFPFIANTAGWFSTELGRQPWLAYDLIRTSEGASRISSGNVLFTLLGFMGMYAIMGMTYIVLMVQEAHHGPHGAGERKDLVDQVSA